MSVWTSDSQVIDLYRSIYRVGAPFSDKALPSSPLSVLQLDPAVLGPEYAHDWEELAEALHWPLVPPDNDDALSLSEFSATSTAWRYGLEAVYTIIGQVRGNGLIPVKAFDYNYVNDVVDEFITLVTPSTQITPRRFQERASKRVDIPAMGPWIDAAESFKRMRFHFSAPGSGVRYVPTHEYLQGKNSTFEFATCGDLMVATGRLGCKQLGLCFTRLHLDYLVGALTRLGNAAEYVARVFSQDDAIHAIDFLSHTTRIAAKARKGNAQKVARAFHKARAIFQMELLESEFHQALAGEVADYATDGLSDVCPLELTLSKLRAMPVKVAMECVHIYKWMPPPDFDATGAPAVVQRFHANPRPSGANWNASPQAAALYERIQVERKINFAHAHKRRHGAWPAGLGPRGNFVTPAEARAWAPSACAIYQQMGTDIVSQVKDKTIVDASIQVERDGRTAPSNRSYLLWYMANAGTVDTRVALKALANGTLAEDNYVRSAYKPEAHKPDSRLFYMAPPVQRTLLGEFEGNISNYARYYPGSLMGKDTAEKDRIVARIMDPLTAVDNIAQGEDYTIYIITFDLAKFSPKSDKDVTRDYHNFWAAVYGMKDLEALYNIGCTSRILHTTAGIHHEYQNHGCDLEGFRGRLMTMFHADMLATACRIGRERGILHGRSDLAVFIDDGAVKVAVDGLGEIARRNAAEFLGIMQEVYEAAGQDNNPTKTVVSQTGGEILSKFHYRGLLIPQGIKALMRLAPDYENAAATFAEDVDQLVATTQGAVKDGANWVVAYRMLADAVVKTALRWTKGKSRVVDPTTMGLLMMTPKSFGGLGVPSLQGLVTNAAVNQTSEGAAMLNRVARMYPQHRMRVHGIISKQVVVREPLSILRDPLRIRLATAVIIENRLTMEVVNWLESNSGEYTRFLAAYRDVDILEHAKEVAEAVLSSGIVNVPFLERVWKSTPLSYVESVVGKFKRSATIISLIGYRRVGRIRKKNQGDLYAVLGL